MNDRAAMPECVARFEAFRRAMAWREHEDALSRGPFVLAPGEVLAFVDYYCVAMLLDATPQRLDPYIDGARFKGITVRVAREEHGNRCER